MLQEWQAHLPEVQGVGFVVSSQKHVPVPELVAIPHVLFYSLTFLLLLPVYIDIPYFYLLVVCVDYCTVCQPQPELGLELGLGPELELELEPLEPLEPLELPEPSELELLE